MKKRAVEFVVGAILLAAVLMGGCGGSVLPQVGQHIDSAASLLNVVCVEETQRCIDARALLGVAIAAYHRAETAEAAGTPDAAALIDQAAKAIEDLLRTVKAL